MNIQNTVSHRIECTPHICSITVTVTVVGVSLLVLRPYAAHCIKMMHKKANKLFAEDKQTKYMHYWNHVLWSDETKINLFGSDGVKRVWRQPGEEYKDKFALLYKLYTHYFTL